MSISIIFFFCFIGAIVSWIIFYYVVKAAVKNGIKDSRIDKGNTPYIQERKPERLANTEQMKLHQRYDKGEITFEIYQSEWNKLGN